MRLRQERLRILARQPLLANQDEQQRRCAKLFRVVAAHARSTCTAVSRSTSSSTSREKECPYLRAKAAARPCPGILWLS